ncbi:MAG: hypothetical protein ACLPKI_20925 [Streptosporangiaceae bacterium]
MAGRPGVGSPIALGPAGVFGIAAALLVWDWAGIVGAQALLF